MTYCMAIPCIIVQVDDILVGGKDDVDYLYNLDAVLTTLSATGLCLKKSNCEFMWHKSLTVDTASVAVKLNQ